MKTTHSFFIAPSQQMSSTKDSSIDLIITSPPYPMIEMWDTVFAKQNPKIGSLIGSFPQEAFELMHQELDHVWNECFRVLKDGGFLCINIGDATRTIDGSFALYNSHSRISNACNRLGFVCLPNILWRKQTNAPNKFMGSGMLPCGAYVTLEHEWILLFRKGNKRSYATTEAKAERMKSSFFWEERNIWFSDVWEVKGTKQKMTSANTRNRSAAFPIEIPYRLINMFSQKGDTVLDPFIGTGTTTQAAMILGRNSCGYEIDPSFEEVIRGGIESMEVDFCNRIIKQRLDSHNQFIQNHKAQGKEPKHFNPFLNCETITSQESSMVFNYLNDIQLNRATGEYTVTYEEHSDLSYLPFKDALFKPPQAMDSRRQIPVAR